MISSTNLHYRITEGNKVLYDDTGKLYNSSFMKCYEVGYDGSASPVMYNDFRLTIKSLNVETGKEIHLEVWVEGYEETKKMVRILYS
nr:MAG TPA: hypothetical protein [Crassvirales sp.]